MSEVTQSILHSRRPQRGAPVDLCTIELVRQPGTEGAAPSPGPQHGPRLHDGGPRLRDGGPRFGMLFLQITRNVVSRGLVTFGCAPSLPGTHCPFFCSANRVRGGGAMPIPTKQYPPARIQPAFRRSTVTPVTSHVTGHRHQSPSVTLDLGGGPSNRISSSRRLYYMY